MTVRRPFGRSRTHGGAPAGRARQPARPPSMPAVALSAAAQQTSRRERRPGLAPVNRALDAPVQQRDEQLRRAVSRQGLRLAARRPQPRPGAAAVGGALDRAPRVDAVERIGRRPREPDVRDDVDLTPGAALVAARVDAVLGRPDPALGIARIDGEVDQGARGCAASARCGRRRARPSPAPRRTSRRPGGPPTGAGRGSRCCPARRPIPTMRPSSRDRIRPSTAGSAESDAGWPDPSSSPLTTVTTSDADTRPEPSGVDKDPVTCAGRAPARTR